MIGVHTCTEDEWSEFYPPRAASLSHFNRLKADKEMLCLNKTDTDLNLYGPNENTPHRSIELMFLPVGCNETTENCTEKLNESKKYVGMPNFLMIVN